MSDVFSETMHATDGAAPRMASNVSQLLTTAQTSGIDALEPLLQHIAAGPIGIEPRTGTEYLLLLCADIQCAVPLTSLREVLTTLPDTVPLPDSPPWLLGIFPHRSEMLGLVDPAPLLLASPTPTDTHWSVSQVGMARPSARQRRSPFGPGLSQTPALIVGNEELSLAWAVGEVGEIALVQDDELRRGVGEGAIADVPFCERYIAGVYAPSQSEARYIVLDVKRLLDDLVQAVAEREEPYE